MSLLSIPSKQYHRSETADKSMKKLIALLISITFLTLPACNRRSITQPAVEYDKRYEETPVPDTWLDKLNKGVGWTWDGTKAVGRWCLEYRTPLIISVVVIGGVISLASYLHGRTPTPQKEAEDNNQIPDLNNDEPAAPPHVEIEGNEEEQLPALPKKPTTDEIQGVFDSLYPQSTGTVIENDTTFKFRGTEYIYYAGAGWMINDGRLPVHPMPEQGFTKNYQNQETGMEKQGNNRIVYNNESSDDEGIVEDEYSLTLAESTLMPIKDIKHSAIPVDRKHNAFLNHKFKEFARLRELDPEPHPGDTVIIGTRAPVAAGKYEYTIKNLWWRIVDIPNPPPRRIK